MSDPAIIAIVGGVQVIALAIIARWHSTTQAAIEVVRKDVDGKMTQLLKVNGESEKAKGVIEGHAEAKAGAKESE